MKKLLVTAPVSVMLTFGAQALATDPIISPEATPVATPGVSEPISPKTGDAGVCAIAGAGVLCAAGAVYCFVRQKRA